MLLPGTDDNYCKIEIYFLLIKVKVERLPVFNYLKNRQTSHGSSSLFEIFCSEHYAGRCIYSALALTLGLRVFSWTGAITTGRLLGPTTCLPHKDGGIPLSASPKDTTSKLAGLFSTLSLFC